jgi:hypothetical protein
MPDVLKKFFFSRKWWAFAVGLVTLLSTAAEDGVFAPDEMQNIVLLIASYVASVAFEDGMSNRNSAPVQVAQAEQVTITEKTAQ